MEIKEGDTVMVIGEGLGTILTVDEANQEARIRMHNRRGESIIRDPKNIVLLCGPCPPAFLDRLYEAPWNLAIFECLAKQLAKHKNNESVHRLPSTIP